MNDSSYINIFATCKITLGYSRSIIIDLQRNDYWFIPNTTAQILSKKIVT